MYGRAGKGHGKGVQGTNIRLLDGLLSQGCSNHPESHWED